MNEEPLVSIIIVNWNGKALILECLSSLHKLSYARVQIILVDNGSTDGSVEAVEQSFPEVNVLRMNKNLGFAGGTNEGLREALRRQAEFVLLLNNDTVVDEHCLKHLVSRIRSEERIGIVAPKIYYHSTPDTIWYAGGNISMWKGVMSHTGIREKDHGQHDALRDTDFATGCCMLASAEVVRRIGFLDESYKMYSEDADWCMRARKAGDRVVYEPKAVLWHKVSSSAGGNLSWFKLRHKLVSNMRFFARHAAWYHWFVFPWLSLAINSGLLVTHAAGCVRRD